MTMKKFATSLAITWALLFIGVFRCFGHFTQNKPPQNSNQSKSTSANSATPSGAQDFSKNTWDLPPDAAQTKNPIESTEESIAKGKEIFMTRKGNCIFCHGENGAGNEENFPKLRRRPADLSKTAWMKKLSDGEIYWKVTKGITGIMPSFDDPRLTKDERWHVVNFVRTLSKPKS